MTHLSESFADIDRPTLKSIVVNSDNDASTTICGPEHEIMITVSTLDNLASLWFSSFKIGSVSRTPELLWTNGPTETKLVTIQGKTSEDHALNVWRARYLVLGDDVGSVTFEVSFRDVAGNYGVPVTNIATVVNRQLTVGEELLTRM